MKINEVEALVGITKKNIRFYEDQGLLAPKRNSENSYREYSDREVRVLLQIKLLRKLGVPLEEIRQMLAGTHTVADGMRRHRVSLEREQRNLQQSIALCQELQTLDIPLQLLEPGPLLERMTAMEETGTFFPNNQERDVRIRYVAPVVITVLTVLLAAGMIVLFLWGYRVSPEDAPPPGVLWLFVGIFGAVGAGVVLALLQRIREIGKGEIDDAKHY